MKKLILGVALLLAFAAGTLYLWPGALVAGITFVERQQAGLSPRQVRVDDLTIHYYEGGPADAETLLMIHGFGANRDNWLRFAHFFTDRYHVIALDLPGFGDSASPPAGTDADALVAPLAECIEAAERIRRFIENA